MSIVPVDIAAAQADQTQKGERIPEPVHRRHLRRLRRPHQAQASSRALSPRAGRPPSRRVRRRRRSPPPSRATTFAPDMKDGIIEGGGVEDSDPKLDPFVDRSLTTSP